jgi:hypothetical protein
MLSVTIIAENKILLVKYHRSVWGFLVLFRRSRKRRTNSTNAGMPGIRTRAMITIEKFCLTSGMLPKK